MAWAGPLCAASQNAWLPQETALRQISQRSPRCFSIIFFYLVTIFFLTLKTLLLFLLSWEGRGSHDVYLFHARWLMWLQSLLFDHHPGRRHLLTGPLPAELQNVCHNKSASGQWNRGAKSVGIAPHRQWLAQLHSKHRSVTAKGGVGYCNRERIVEPIISLEQGNIFQIITQLRVVLFLPKIQDNLWKRSQYRSQGSSEKYLCTESVPR